MSVWTDFFAPPPGRNPALTIGTSEFKGALVIKSGSQSIATSTNVDLTWQTASYDTNGFYSAGSPTKLTVPAGVTRVRLSGVVDWSATAAQNKRAVVILKNDAVFDGAGQNTRIDSTTASDEQRQSVISAIVDVVEGDFFEINVRQTSGGGKNVETSSWFAIEVIEGLAPVAAQGAPFKGIRRHRTTQSASFPTGATNNILWDDADEIQYDIGGWEFSDSEIVIPAGVTKVKMVFGYYTNAGGLDAGEIQFHIRRTSGGGGAIAATVVENIETTIPNKGSVDTGTFEVTPGETFRVDFGHNTGGNQFLAATETFWSVEAVEAIAPSVTPRGALVKQATTFSLLDNITTTVTWNDEEYDTDNIHDNVTNNSRLTVPANVTHVRLLGNYRENSNTSGWRFIQLLKNGTIEMGLPVTSGGASGSNTHMFNAVSSVLEVVEGDYFEMQIFQNSGSTRSISGNNFWFAMEIVAPSVIIGDPAQVLQTLADGANIPWNHNTSRTAQVTLAGSRILDNPTNSVEGLEYTLKVIQDATGSRTLTYGSAYKFASGTPPTLTATANAIDILRFWFDGTNYINIGFTANIS